MAQCGPNMIPNVPKWPKMDQDGPRPKVTQNCKKMTQNGKKMTQNDHKWPQMTQNGTKWPKNDILMWGVPT